MCMFHSQLIDLDPSDPFCEVSPEIYFSFLSWGKNMYTYDTMDEAVRPLHNTFKKIKTGIPITCTFFAVPSKV